MVCGRGMTQMFGYARSLASEAEAAVAAVAVGSCPSHWTVSYSEVGRDMILCSNGLQVNHDTVTRIGSSYNITFICMYI